LYQWLLQAPTSITTNYEPIPALTGFSFNEHTSLARRLKIVLHTDWQAGELRIIIPAISPVQDIAAPASTVAVILQVAALTCHLQTVTVKHAMAEPLTMSYTNSLLPAQILALPLTIEADCIALVAARLRYNNAAAEIKKLEWMPAGIVSAIG